MSLIDWVQTLAILGVMLALVLRARRDDLRTRVAAARRRDLFERLAAPPVAGEKPGRVAAREYLAARVAKGGD